MLIAAPLTNTWKIQTVPVSPWIVEELNKISHREYSTGFYFGQTNSLLDSGGWCR